MIGYNEKKERIGLKPFEELSREEMIECHQALVDSYAGLLGYLGKRVRDDAE